MDLGIFFLMLIIPAIAQAFVSLSYGKYKQIENKKKLTGFDVARQILDNNGLEDLYIVETKGNLTDHYDASKKVVRLSSDIYHDTTIASLAVAAHECGHAIQDKEGYFYMRFRALIFPAVNIATSFSYLMIVLGILFQSFHLIKIGIFLVGTGLFFQIITLPVEINASKRAKEELKKLNLADKVEQEGVRSMLSAAASTYVAGILSSALEMVRLILAFQNREE